MHIPIKINRYGKAMTIAIVCTVVTPPDKINAKATIAIKIPQKIFFLFEGSSSPFDVNIAKTKVAESDEVTKNVTNKTMAITDKIIPD